jgi:hypothetical protein
MIGNMTFDEVLKAVRRGDELYMPIGGQGMGIENVKGNKVTKAGIGDFLRAAKARAFRQNPISPNQADYVNWILWDRVTYAASAVVPNLQKLFVAPIGTNSKTKVDTNLELVSSLPAPQWFNTTGIAIHFNNNAAPIDLYNYLNTEYLEFWVSQKVYVEGPLDQFPSAGGLFNNTALGTMTAAATSYITNSVNGWPSAHNMYDLRLPAGLGLGMDANGAAVQADGLLGITILQSQTFHVELKADGVPIASPGLTVSCRLHGQLSRGVQ